MIAEALRNRGTGCDIVCKHGMRRGGSQAWHWRHHGYEKQHPWSVKEMEIWSWAERVLELTKKNKGILSNIHKGHNI